MAKKAADIFIENQLDPELGDKVYCLVDLDLEQCKYEKYVKAKKKYKNIEIIPSNPCFEIWLLYYFTEAPKVVHSSQRVKEEMVKKLPGYTESMDVVDVAKLYDKHWIAIKNSETKNSRYAEELNMISKNPYTEVATVVKELLRRLNES